MPDDDAPDGRHFHCFESTVKEIVPYSNTRAKYPDFRVYKHIVALVQWEAEFGKKTRALQLNPNKYERELE